MEKGGGRMAGEEGGGGRTRKERGGQEGGLGGIAFSDGFFMVGEELQASGAGDHATGSRWFRVTTRDVRAERDYNDPRLRVTEATWPNRVRAVQQYTC